jgi:hypothetical protein
MQTPQPRVCRCLCVVQRGDVQVGDRVYPGDDRVCVSVLPVLLLSLSLLFSCG